MKLKGKIFKENKETKFAYCFDCFRKLAKRIYIRVNHKWIGIGFYCEGCHKIVLDKEIVIGEYFDGF